MPTTELLKSACRGTEGGLAWGLAALLAIGLATPADAQSGQYTRLGGPPRDRGSDREALEEEMEDARWSLGPVRLAPWIGVSQLQWVDDVFAAAEGEEGKVSDLTATAGAGLTAYLTTGGKVFWTAAARPEYVWWQDLDERRQSVLSSRATVDGFFNRLRLAGGFERRELQGFLTFEEPQLTVTRSDQTWGSVRLRLASRLWIAAAAERLELEDIGDDDGTPDADPGTGEVLFERLDRRTDRRQVGLEYITPGGLVVGVGAEELETELAATARRQSHEDISPYLSIVRPGDNLELRLHLVDRTLTPTETQSELVPVDEVAAELGVTLTPGWRLAWSLTASRSPAYTLFAEYSHFVEDRLGLGVGIALDRRERIRLELAGQVGELSYVRLDPAAPPRADDLELWRADLVVGRRRGGFELRVGWEQVELKSSLAGFDRTVGRLRTAISFGTGGLVWK